MFGFIQKLLLDPTRRHIAINTFGNYLNVFFTALFALIFVRIMSPEQYGTLSVLLAIMYVATQILDFGTTATIYSNVPNLYVAKDHKMFQFIKSTFVFQSFFAVIAIVLLIIAFPYLDKMFFKTGAERWVLYITTISIMCLIWQNFTMNIMFAAKKFLEYNLYLNIANIIKLLTILSFAFWGQITVGLIMFIFGILGPSLLFLFLLASNSKLIPHFYEANIKKEEFRFSYTLTYFLASQFYNLGLRMDLFLLSFFVGIVGKESIGFYGLAQKIVLTIITSIISITQVLSPGFASATSKTEAKQQLIKALKYLVFPAAILVVLFFTPQFVFRLAFTENFVETYSITRSLALPFILNAIGSAPMLFLLYTVKKPGYILISNILFFIIISIGSYYLIPTKGVFGPPIAIGLAFMVATVIQTAAMVKEFTHLKAK